MLNKFKNLIFSIIKQLDLLNLGVIKYIWIEV